MKFIKKTVILSCPDGGNYDCLKMETKGNRVEVIYSPSLYLNGCLIGIKEKDMRVQINPLVFPLTRLNMSEEFSYGDFAEFIIVDPRMMTVKLYGNTHSTYPNKFTLLNGFSAYSKKTVTVDNESRQRETATVSVDSEVKTTAQIKVLETDKPKNNKETAKAEQVQAIQKAIDKAEHIKDNTAKTVELNIVGTQVKPNEKVEIQVSQKVEIMADLQQKRHDGYEVFENGDIQDEEKESPSTSYYYDSIKDDIEQLLETKPAVPELSALIDGSRWAKIEQDEGYVVGVIYDNGKPLFVCYGIKGVESSRPSDEYHFVETTAGKGYWLIYQNANTGKVEG